MTWIADALRSTAVVIWLLIRAGLNSVRSNWGLALFSVAAALFVWVVVQDVENPRETGMFPPEGESPNIVVEPRNLPDGFLVLQNPAVSVVVEARAEDFEDLKPSDFRATIDLQNAPTDGGSTVRTVRVESRREGVEVLSVQPSEVEVSIVPAARRLMTVEVRLTGDLPDGFEAVGEPVLNPSEVEVYGIESIVEAIASVTMDVNLSGVRTDEFVADGELTARNASGNALSVRFFDGDQQITRATATYQIREISRQRSMALEPTITGQPATGYRLAGYTIDPNRVMVTAPAAILDGLTTALQLEDIDITNATGNVQATVGIETPPNVEPERSSVTVTVLIEPISCGDETDPCAAFLFVVAPTFSAAPAGLVVAAGEYRVAIEVSGDLPELAGLEPTDFEATVDLSEAVEGPGTFSPSVTAPPGVTVVDVEDIQVTLIAGAP